MATQTHFFWGEGGKITMKKESLINFDFVYLETTSHAQTGGFDCDFSDSQCDWNNIEDGWKWAR